MDQFIKILKEKEFDIPPQWAEIADIVNRQRNSLCIHGRPGVGKSHLVKKIILRCLRWVEMTEDILRSKNATLDFLAKVSSSRVVVIDEDNLEMIGLRELNPDGDHQIILITAVPTPSICDLFDTVEIKPMPVYRMVNDIGKVKFPNVDTEHIKDLALRSKGNIRTFLISLEFALDEGTRDIFKTPKEFVYDLVCKDRPEPENPLDHLCQGVHEHGYTWGIIHENYLDSSGLTLDDVVTISDGMSIADNIDSVIYSERSVDSSFALFTHFGIVTPSIKLKHSLDASTMRPGSSWTKYNNFKMRYIKIKGLSYKNGCTLYCSDHEHIQCFVMHMNEGNADLLRNYGLESSDLDVFNHLAGINSKLKTKALQNLKRRLCR
jgi:hypothetical protein